MFGNVFSKKKSEDLNMERILLIDENQIDDLLQASNQKPVLLFKHSTSCGISAMVLKRFENDLQKKNNTYHYYYLDLLRYRNISGIIAEKFNIVHQSPQLLLIQNGIVKDHSSHYGIMQMEL